MKVALSKAAKGTERTHDFGPLDWKVCKFFPHGRKSWNFTENFFKHWTSIPMLYLTSIICHSHFWKVSKDARSRSENLWKFALKREIFWNDIMYGISFEKHSKGSKKIENGIFINAVDTAGRKKYQPKILNSPFCTMFHHFNQKKFRFNNFEKHIWLIIFTNQKFIFNISDHN